MPDQFLYQGSVASPSHIQRRSEIFIQPKIAIDNPGDQYEQEADRIAEQITKAEPDSSLVEPTLMPANPVQRKCADCEEEERIQRKEGEGEEGGIESRELEHYIGTLSSAGEALPSETRNYFEPRFGYDLSDVRVHRNQVAAQSAQSINALAYTFDNNIVFNAAQYDPATHAGKKLLAHELTHVIQQSGNSPVSVQRKPSKPRKKSDTRTKGGSGQSQTQGPDLHVIPMQWRSSVINTIFQYIRPFGRFGPGKLLDQQILEWVETFVTKDIQANSYQISYTEGNQPVERRGLQLSDLEQMMNQYKVENFQLESPDVLLKYLNLDWQQYQKMVEDYKQLSEVQGLFDVLDTHDTRITTLPPPGIILPDNITAEEKALVDRFLQELQGDKPAPQKEPGEDQDPLRISKADLDALKQLYRPGNEAQQAELMKILRGSKKRPGVPATIGFAHLIEIAEASQRVQADDKKFGRDSGGQIEKPIVQRPVHGHIQPPGNLITSGTEAKFVFVVDDDVDAFKVPMVTIFWNAVDSNGKVVRAEAMRYIDVRDDSWLNDKEFQVEFDNPGEYMVYARVHHNFYYPNAFPLAVSVITTETALNEMRSKSDKDEGKFSNIQEFEDYNFSMQGLSDIGEYDEGSRAYGDLVADTAPSLSFNADIQKIDGQIQRLRQLQTHYEKDGVVNKDMKEWIEGRIKRLTETKSSLTNSRDSSKNFGIQVRGFYASRKSGVRSGPLSLVAWFQRADKQFESLGFKYIGHAFDRSEIAENENLHHQGLGTNYEEMLENLFVNLSGEYPDGEMEISFQLYDENDKPTRRTVTYRRVTDTVGGDIYNVVYSVPAQILVNVVSALLTMFPPTTALGIGLGLAYNSGEVISNINSRLRTGRNIRTSDIVDAALLVLDVIPVAGLLAKETSLAYKVVRVSTEVAQLGGQFYIVTEQALEQIQQLRDGLVEQLSQTYQRISVMQENGAPASVQRGELDQMRRLEKDIQSAALDVSSQLLVYQAAIMGSQHMIRSKFQDYLQNVSPDTRRKWGLDKTPGQQGAPVPDASGRLPQADATTTTPKLTSHPNLPVDSVRGINGVFHNPDLSAHEVRVRYDIDADGHITSIFVEAGRDAKKMHLDEHLPTIRALQRYQGFSGQVRIALIKLNNVFARTMRMPEAQRPLPGSRAFDAKGEIEKLPGIIRARAALLTSSDLPVHRRAEIEAEITHLQAELQKHMKTLDDLDMEMGDMFIAATVPKSNKDAISAGYPQPPEGHYYYRTQDGNYQVRRFAFNNATPQMIVFENGKPVLRPRPAGAVEIYVEPLKVGESRVYKGADGKVATVHRAADGTIVITSELGSSHGRQGYERQLFTGVDFGKDGYELMQRAHSQGQGTGHESPYGILYAPIEVNQQFQNQGIEKFMRELFATVPKEIPLVLKTHTRAHEGTLLLSEIEYTIHAKMPDGRVELLYYVSIAVDDVRLDPTKTPRVQIHAAEGYHGMELQVK